MPTQLREFVEILHQQVSDKREQTQSDLMEIANEIRRICDAYPIDESIYPPARGTQELVYPIAVSESGGPSLYLVSDAAGVSSAPHEHPTWAVIVGLSGSETNTLFPNFASRSYAFNAVVWRMLARIFSISYLSRSQSLHLPQLADGL